MPTLARDVKEFFERLTALEAKVEGLMAYQKWQMALLAALLLMLLKVVVKI